MNIDAQRTIDNVLAIGNNLAIAQEKFMQSNLFDIFNTALDTGIKIALPDIAEDIVIDIKDSLLENGFVEGSKQIWNNIKEFGKSALGIVSGKFENIEQVQTATKNGGVLDIVSNIFDFALDKAVDNEKITKSMKNSIKSKKNSIVKDIKNKVSENLEKQEKNIEKLNEYNNKWEKCFEEKDLKGMKNAKNNITKYLEKVMPLENVINNARKIEIMHNLIESTGSFDITDEEKELASALAY